MGLVHGEWEITEGLVRLVGGGVVAESNRANKRVLSVNGLFSSAISLDLQSP
jgi:hypothetical protein